MTFKVYEQINFSFDNNEILYLNVIAPDGETAKVEPFRFGGYEARYDEEGYESICEADGAEYICRYSPKMEGTYKTEAYFKDGKTEKNGFDVSGFEGHGYVAVSKKDKRYFAYTDETPFLPIGINLCYPTAYSLGNGKEFGLSGKDSFLGLRQYERWFKDCADNGVNYARLWLGCDYFVYYNEQSELRYEQLYKIEKAVALAHKYGIKLKLTLEHFRVLTDKKEKSLFEKTVEKDGRLCTTAEFLNDDYWKNNWLSLVGELSKRFAYSTDVAAIELWNEMNCFGSNVISWNNDMSDKVKKLFPNQPVINSLGSYDSDYSKTAYDNFPWHKFDFKQIHSYLDQGSKYKMPTVSPIEGIGFCVKEQATDEMPVIVAETGAVNNNHSGPFRYYSADHRGIIFADCVYTPLFLGCAGSGNIWHWDARYVESKNLYGMYAPLKELTRNISFDEEGFVPEDYSDGDVYMLALKGRKHTLVYIRNTSDNWRNTLRDLKEVEIRNQITVPIKSENAELINIWDENIGIEKSDKGILLNNLKYGCFLKLTVTAH